MKKDPPVFYRPDTLKPDESIGRLMREIMSALASQVDRELAPLGLTEAQWMPLLKLHLNLASTSTELARECRTDAGATTRMIDRLEEKGFIQRARSAQDRRVVNLELTPEGRSTAQHIPAVLCKVQNELLQDFSQEEFDTLKSLLRRMLGSAKALAAAKEPRA
ncbi:MAG: MarR family transcriptional regulator [Hydrogenophaga sp.]|uniref:MarR family winged helix-turn-helix transcriptional regulator n=1 Tax=Hydrogenophaga sp. TaxID=1904254 RepID=UPI0016AC4CEF|nr:MarR family transcriptional regulator [Hydrogenophaga sp.]NIM39641.1 MarR family transcriptional regulator [Hydrogenophaga sp.]NIN24845.1 MarR family transcriptional regulator [Hydrogenophaga sp.]NIN29357.1 MarR family transcriptional regulator [Hydrogenophaga sp.]NIN53880.1 MarR family transcriptional regulator [Hydrogenophaga sp.]NIO50084.1 MarR family transcriptional regulator [Hydrogenophaga sp.]